MISNIDSPKAKYILLTGATGLLGEYLIRDLMSMGFRLAVVVRSSRNETARERIESICRRWESRLGRLLPRPVVIEGDIGLPGWGISKGDHEWIRSHCRALLHNAASLQFVAASRMDEPWMTNLAGTQVMLELAAHWQIEHLHHVSTAYICGLRSGKVLESELDVGQKFGNDYEASKCLSEWMIKKASDQFQTITVYRPAIITGDHSTGHTTTFHGLYAPLKIASALLGPSTAIEVPQQSLIEVLGLQGPEEKNFVPVDWVSGSIARIISRPPLHNETYHLTPEYRTGCQLLADTMYETLTEHLASRDSQKNRRTEGKPSSTLSSDLLLQSIQSSFRSQMSVYESYWRNDPEFDREKIRRALPEFNPPPVDRECLKRLCRFALKSNFGWPKPKGELPSLWASDRVLKPKSLGQIRSTDFNVRIVGAGGGDFSIESDTDGNWITSPGLDPRCSPLVILSSHVFHRISEGTLGFDQARRSGALLTIDLGLDDDGEKVCRAWFEGLTADKKVSSFSSRRNGILRGQANS